MPLGRQSMAAVLSPCSVLGETVTWPSGPMGQIAAERADIVIATDDNPRTEDPAVIRAADVGGGP